MPDASYISSWDIDQLIDSGEISLFVPAGSTGSPAFSNATLPVSNVEFPDCKVVFKGEGQSVWHQAYIDTTGWDIAHASGVLYWPGLNKTNGVTVQYQINQHSVELVACNTGPDQTITIRYYIWGETILW